MKFLVKFLIFFLLLFTLNIIFYYVSNDYKVFLENLKYKKITKDSQNVSNNLKTQIDFNQKNIIKNELEEKIIEDKKFEKDLESIAITNDNIKVVQKTILWKYYKDILNKFEKKYQFDKIEVNTKLFEITDEYPDYYYEYYSDDLTLYFFTSKQYSDIYNIFDYLKHDLPISINELNNFWEKSFYINLNKEIDDKYIRLVISENGITYWLKINNKEYDKVKNLL